MFLFAFSGPDGSLVSNAPHMPVHLGSMSQTVRAMDKYYTTGPGAEDGLLEGDVLVSNHPQLAGGSHLPDLTVVTPVFRNGKVRSNRLPHSCAVPLPADGLHSTGLTGPPILPLCRRKYFT